MYGTGGVPRTPAATTRSGGWRPAALPSTSTSSAAGTGRLTVLTTGTPPTSSTTAARMAGDAEAGVGMATSNLAALRPAGTVREKQGAAGAPELRGPAW